MPGLLLKKASTGSWPQDSVYPGGVQVRQGGTKKPVRKGGTASPRCSCCLAAQRLDTARSWNSLYQSAWGGAGEEGSGLFHVCCQEGSGSGPSPSELPPVSLQWRETNMLSYWAQKNVIDVPSPRYCVCVNNDLSQAAPQRNFPPRGNENIKGLRCGPHEHWAWPCPHLPHSHTKVHTSSTQKGGEFTELGAGCHGPVSWGAGAALQDCRVQVFTTGVPGPRYRETGLRSSSVIFWLEFCLRNWTLQICSGHLQCLFFNQPEFLLKYCDSESFKKNTKTTGLVSSCPKGMDQGWKGAKSSTKKGCSCSRYISFPFPSCLYALL